MLVGYDESACLSLHRSNPLKQTHRNQWPRYLSQSPDRSPAADSWSVLGRASGVAPGGKTRVTCPSGRFPFHRWEEGTLEDWRYTISLQTLDGSGKKRSAPTSIAVSVVATAVFMAIFQHRRGQGCCVRWSIVCRSICVSTVYYDSERVGVRLHTAHRHTTSHSHTVCDSNEQRVLSAEGSQRKRYPTELSISTLAGALLVTVAGVCSSTAAFVMVEKVSGGFWLQLPHVEKAPKLYE